VVGWTTRACKQGRVTPGMYIPNALPRFARGTCPMSRSLPCDGSAEWYNRRRAPSTKSVQRKARNALSPPPPRPNPLLKRQKAKSRNPQRGISNRLKQKCNLWSAGSYNTVDSWEQVTYLVIPSATNRIDCISKTFSKRELR